MVPGISSLPGYLHSGPCVPCLATLQVASNRSHSPPPGRNRCSPTFAMILNNTMAKENDFVFIAIYPLCVTRLTWPISSLATERIHRKDLFLGSNYSKNVHEFLLWFIVGGWPHTGGDANGLTFTTLSEASGGICGMGSGQTTQNPRSRGYGLCCLCICRHHRPLIGGWALGSTKLLFQREGSEAPTSGNSCVSVHTSGWTKSHVNDLNKDRDEKPIVGKWQMWELFV